MNKTNDSCEHRNPSTVRLRSALGKALETVQAAVIALSLQADDRQAARTECCRNVAVELAVLHAELMALLASTADVAEDGGARGLSLFERDLLPLEQIRVQPSRFTLDSNHVGVGRGDHDPRLVVAVEQLAEDGWCITSAARIWDFDRSQWAAGQEFRDAVDQGAFIRDLRVALAAGRRQLEVIRAGLDGKRDAVGDEPAARPERNRTGCPVITRPHVALRC